ncbi:MAG: ester cyclase [Anaerolineae bacterium]|nr:ester cyclase [Anaerolineae bacterium]
MVIQVTYHGTQHGDFLGIPSTDCVITLPCILMFRIEDDLIVENWTEMDIFGVVNQISTARQLCPNPQLSAN